MIKRILVFLCLTILLICSFTLPQTTMANANVKDCIETDDCEEEDESTGEVGREDTEDEPPFKQTSLLMNIVKMVVALFFVLALIYLFLTILKRRNKLYERSSVLENLGGVSVGQQKSIQMIRIGSKVFVIGVGEDINLLYEIKDEDIKEQVLSEQMNPNEPLSFLKNIFNRKDQHDKDQINIHTEEEQFQRTFQQELSKLKENRSSIVDRYLENKRDDDKHV